MKNEIIRDGSGKQVYRKVEFSNGRQELRDIHGKLIGAYDPHRKATLGPKGNALSSGNLLGGILGSLLGK